MVAGGAHAGPARQAGHIKRQLDTLRAQMQKSLLGRSPWTEAGQVTPRPLRVAGGAESGGRGSVAPDAHRDPAPVEPGERIAHARQVRRGGPGWKGHFQVRPWSGAQGVLAD